MQNRSFIPYFSAIPLPESFPASLGTHRQYYLTQQDMHVHDCLELGLCLGGFGVFFVEGEVFPFAKGSVSVIPAGVAHIGQSPPDQGSDWIFLSLDAGFFGLHAEAAGIFCDGVLARIFGLMTDVPRGAPDDRALFSDLASAFSSRLKQLIPHPKPLGASRPVLSALRFAALHCTEPIGVRELADAAGYSEPHFRRLFAGTTGKTPLRYLNDCRVALAEACLQRGKSVTETALSCGFGSVSGFYRAYLARNGRPPREAKKE